MLRAIWFIIRNSKFLLGTFIIMVLISPFLLWYSTDLSLKRSAIITFEIAMAEPPTDFEPLLVKPSVHWINYLIGMVWLFFLQFLSWLIIPILIGVIFEEGQRRLEQQQIQLKEQEARLEEISRETRERVIESFKAFGSEEASAIKEAGELFKKWDEILSEIGTVTTESKIKRLTRKIGQYGQRIKSLKRSLFR